MKKTSKPSLPNTSHFTDAQYMTAQQKRRVLGDWVRFFAGGMEFKRFTKRLYEHLTLHCSYIAHFGRQGFFETYFADPEALQRFLDQFDRSNGCVSTEYGMTYWIRDGNDVSAAYYDLNNALVDTIADMLPALREQARQRSVATAREQLRASEQKLARLEAVSREAVE